MVQGEMAGLAEGENSTINIDNLVLWPSFPFRDQSLQVWKQLTRTGTQELEPMTSDKNT